MPEQKQGPGGKTPEDAARGPQRGGGQDSSKAPPKPAQEQPWKPPGASQGHPGKPKAPAKCPNCAQTRAGGVVKVTEAGLCVECGREVPEAPPYPSFDDLGENVPTFEDYFEGHVDQIRKTQAILATGLNDDPVVMDRQIRETEETLGAMKSILGWADSYLDVAEHQALAAMPSRSGGFTDLDRDKAMSAAVARQRRFRNIVRGIIESTETRISYGQSRLRFIERNHG